jgi:putative holliday junction resolvase
MRILSVDPGSKRIGLAISDATSIIASPLMVIQHTDRLSDAREIAGQSLKNEAGLIIVGQSLDDEGIPTFEGRRSQRLAEAIRSLTSIPVVMWDETLTTRDAREVRQSMGVSRRKRSGHLDSLAAAVLLQSYLDHTKE